MGRPHYLRKPELLRKMDTAVVLQREAAHRIARSMGGSFFPAPEKGSYLGLLVMPQVSGKMMDPIRLEVRVRNFPSTEHDSSLVEKRVLDRVKGKGVLYCEAFSDDVAIAYDVDAIRDLLVFGGTECNSTTVVVGEKREKQVAYVPHALGARVQMVRMTQTVIGEHAAPIAKPEPRTEPLF